MMYIFFGSSFTTSNAPRTINIMAFQFGQLKVLATKQLNTCRTPAFQLKFKGIFHIKGFERRQK